MRAVLLITARLKSRRLPNKVLLDLGGKPVIVRMLERARRAGRVQDVVVCTSRDPQDDELCAVVEREGVQCFRGSAEDVLVRLRDAARAVKAEYVLNATADNPLLEPEYLDRMVTTYAQSHPDLITAYQLPRGAYGWGVDIAALQRVCEMKAEADTEVWGPYFTTTGLFRVHELEVEPAVRRPDLRLTLDYPEDLELLRRIFARLGTDGKAFSLREIVALLDAEPALPAINRHCQSLYETHLKRSAPVRLKPGWAQRATVAVADNASRQEIR